MCARPIASGTVSFGLVAIPVKLYATVNHSSTIRFNQLHEACGTRVKQQLFCPTCEEVVSRDDIVKGYEFSKNQYVLFSEEELENFVVKATHSVEISEFVPLEQVDPVFFERSYYLGPDRGGERPYALLSEALRETKRAALGQYAARGKQYLVLVRPFEEGLVMEQLHYAEEIRNFSEVPLGEGEPKKGELELAKQLIDQTAGDEFRPKAYEDDTRAKILKVIEQKVQGEEITAPPEAAPKAQIIDLMEALKASLSEGEAKVEKRKPPKAAPRSRARSRKASGAGK